MRVSGLALFFEALKNNISNVILKHPHREAFSERGLFQRVANFHELLLSHADAYEKERLRIGIL